MPRWTVSIGNEGDVVAIERTGDGFVVLDIPSHRPVPATRAEVEDLRRKLGAAIAEDPGDLP